MSTRPPYSGSQRKLVLSFDIGTTFSGISYCILDPGEIPEIKGVTRFPAQEQVGGDSKIPTIIYYDANGEVKAVGAEAMQESLEESVQDDGWAKAEWFKLHLRPKSTPGLNVNNALPPLPEDKSAIEIFGDFMRYLYHCAGTYIRETHPNGTDLWASLEPAIDFVLTHPNGWEGAQQQQLREAAVLGGLISNTNEGHARVHFVTEGEASLHFCVQRGLAADAMKKGEGVLIVDAGGGTIDLSAYGQTSSEKPHSFQEISPPACHFQGSIFVTSNAREYFQAPTVARLQGTKFVEDVGHIAQCFDKSTKLRFRNLNEPQWIKFGTARDKDPKLDIRFGQMKISGADVAAFFEPSVNCIVDAIQDQKSKALKPISSVFLVGGYAASDWLFSQLKIKLEPLGIDFCRPDSHVNKAVADGAVSFFVDHFVTARVSKFSYGTSCSIHYDARNAEHLRRLARAYVDVAGYQCIPNCYSVILPKDTQVSETTEFRRSFCLERKSIDAFGSQITDEILCYRGSSSNPEWTDVDPGMYSKLCTVVTKTPDFQHTIQRLDSRDGMLYFMISYDIILSFGLTELTAQVSWKENGKEKRGPAKIVYDHDISS